MTFTNEIAELKKIKKDIRNIKKDILNLNKTTTYKGLREKTYIFIDYDLYEVLEMTKQRIKDLKIVD